jgi:hypothetical protein
MIPDLIVLGCAFLTPPIPTLLALLGRVLALWPEFESNIGANHIGCNVLFWIRAAFAVYIYLVLHVTVTWCSTAAVIPII